jgi:glycosyltransferase involved in cell wall biosynthesis
MARLHQKKGIVPLVKAWTKVMKNAPAKLIIAGPDEGELSKFHHFLGGNVVYLGPVYGDEKVKLLNEAHYYVLPSFSEGFPSSVLEAMSFGAIPLISKGCNFPEVFDQKLGYNIEPDEISIGKVLSMLRVRDYDTAKSHENHLFIKEGYAESRIAEKLFALYSQCIRSLKVRNTHAFIL